MTYLSVDWLWKVCKVKPVREYRFAPPRKFRFDFAFVDQKIAVEQEGGIWTHGRHVRGKGFQNDMIKYNLAAKMGWRVFRFVPRDFIKGNAQLYMSEIVNREIASISSAEES